MAATTSMLLSPFDNILLRCWLKFIICLPMKPDQQPETAFKYLQESFSQTIVQIPFVAGKLAERDLDKSDSKPGQLEIRIPTPFDEELAPKLRFKDLTASMDYADLMAAGLPEEALDDEVLISAALSPTVDQGIAVLVAQANFIKGGCLLGVGVHHSVADGTGMLAIVKVWAEQCRKLQVQDTMSPQRIVPAESFDRERLQKIWLAERNKGGENEKIDKSDELYWLLGLDPVTSLHNKPNITTLQSSTASVPEALPLMETSIFYMSRGALSDLKRAASPERSELSENHPVISAHDALTAFLWRSIMSARFPPGSPESVGHPTAILESAVDVRAQFSTAVPPLYFGNLVLINTTSMPLSTLTSPSTKLSQVAVEIRKTLNTINTSRVHSAFALASSIPDYTTLTHQYARLDGAKLALTSVFSMPLFELEFGDVFANQGRPEGFRPLLADFDAVCRICFVLPQRTTGGFEILISLLKEEMERLMADKSFGIFAKFCCH